MRVLRNPLVSWGLLSGILLAGGATGAVRLGLYPGKAAEASNPPTAPVSEDSGADTSAAIGVKTIHPKRDPSFAITVQELANVEPYYRADLRSRVAGPIKFIRKDIGEAVKKGEVLAEIDVPDLVQAVAQKEAVIDQRRREVDVARADEAVAQRTVEAAAKDIELKRAEVVRADSEKLLHQQKLERYRYLEQTKQAVAAMMVEEQVSASQTANAARLSAGVAVEKASADWEKTKANLEAAKADVKLKQALVDVARQDRDFALAMADMAIIRAPFDGVITDRPLDPGAFVQNASTAKADPIFSVERTDIVTVTTKIPDNFAPYVTNNTEAVLQVGDLVIRGRVTRYSPSIVNKDRTMRVEVDLYNGTELAYERFRLRALATLLAPLAPGNAVEMTTLMTLGHAVWEQHRKGEVTSFPSLPQITSASGKSRQRRLLPGTTGYMRLVLNKFGSEYLLPSGAVVSRGGKNFILEVRNCKVHLLPVEVQADDGKLAKVAVVVRESNAKAGQQTSLRDLTGKEEIVQSGQGELAEGQVVDATLDDDWNE